MKPDEGAKAGVLHLPRPASPVAAGLQKVMHAEDVAAVSGAGEPDPLDLFSDLGTLIVESRLPQAGTRGYGEGPHCPSSSATPNRHQCDPSLPECQLHEQRQKHMLLLWRNSIPMSIEVLLYPECCSAEHATATHPDVSALPELSYLLLEQWTIHMFPSRLIPDSTVTPRVLIQAVRSYLHFSQISSWLSASRGKAPQHIHYRLCVPGEAFSCKFSDEPSSHVFPIANVGRSNILKVQLKSRARTEHIPTIICEKHSWRKQPQHPKMVLDSNSYGEYFPPPPTTSSTPSFPGPSLAALGDSLLDPPPSIEMYPKRYQSPSRSGSPSLEAPAHLGYGAAALDRSRPARRPVVERFLKKHLKGHPAELAAKERQQDQVFKSSECLLPPDEVAHVLDGLRQRNAKSSSSPSLSPFTLHHRCKPVTLSQNGHSPPPTGDPSSSNLLPFQCESPKQSSIGGARSKTWANIQHQRLLLKQAEANKGIPSAESKAQFRRSLDSATSMVFHQNNGLPLTSSPAPIRKSGTCFDFDSSLTSVSAIKRALFEKEPDVGEDEDKAKFRLSASSPATTSALLGNFEESVLNGRLEPVSTVEGFTAEIGASGSFVPKHLTRLVTVFFYNLHNSDKLTSPYLGHINLGTKGYQVPKSGTIQVTLFNPHRTVVKMFVVRYDLEDMPPFSQTFLRQRTLYMPAGAPEDHPDSRKWLRYLIHLRFLSTRSGRIFLHTDIRVIIFNKSDMDAATIHGQITTPYELRSFTQYPHNPKYSPRK